ncbi:uroporphyrinogen-III synthase [Aquimarina sp. 2-A2]|uniref:uroporphyrinogen-III synthase n=1 Tax=Aquimarina sp. 2-A2 TaxID=3382644 RepID=UPI00387F1A78
MTLLSTKILTPAQKELLLGSGHGLVHYDAIAIQPLAVELQQTSLKNAIFTSKNAIKAILNTNLTIENCFCVGNTTKELLSLHGFKVVEVEDNALLLAQKISNSYAKEAFTFFCGDLRRDELPKHLRLQSVAFNEVTVYRTELQFKTFSRTFDCILFFSPSGVQSYMNTNNAGNAIACCIGKTTATAAEQFFQTTIVANKTTVENVIVTAIKQLKIKNN